MSVSLVGFALLMKVVRTQNSHVTRTCICICMLYMYASRVSVVRFVAIYEVIVLHTFQIHFVRHTSTVEDKNATNVILILFKA